MKESKTAAPEGPKTRGRIFIGPIEISGYYRNLAAGLAQLGVPHDFVTFHNHPMQYGGDAHPPVLVRLIRYATHQTQRWPNLPKPLRWTVQLLRQFVALLYMCQCIARYDAFIFVFGQSLLARNLDLPILRLFRKRIIVNVSHGSEMRPPYIDGAQASPDGSTRPGPAGLARMAASVKRRMVFYERYASHIIGAPFSSTQFALRKQVNSFALGMPTPTGLFARLGWDPDRDADDGAEHANGVTGRPVRLLHAPSHPAGKGSARIRSAVARLKAKGLSIDYVEIRGRPNHEVLAAIRHCDFVVDQLYSDTPLSGFGMEASMFAKPVLVCGYGLIELRRFVAQGMYAPTFVGHPDELDSMLEKLVREPGLRAKLGHDALDFLRAAFAPEDVARRYMRIVHDDIPSDWWFDPNEIDYLHGAGMEKGIAQLTVRELVKSHGVQALQLSDKPNLERLMVQFASEKSDT